jgi:hypothetical protein
VLAAISLFLAGKLWLDPTTSCSVTVERSSSSASSTAGTASSDDCTVTDGVATKVTIAESRNAADSKEFVVALVGLAGALALVATFYSRISKVSFPGGSLELRELAEKTTQAVGDASTNLEALSQALAGVKSAVEKAQSDLELESRRRSLSVEMLQLELARLEAKLPRGSRRRPSDRNNETDQ